MHAAVRAISNVMIVAAGQRGARLALAVLAMSLGCGVPDIQLLEDAGDAGDATAGQGADAVAGDDGAVSDDGPDPDGDASPFCSGVLPPSPAKCCEGGAVCYGTCNKNSCPACALCPWPKVCCTQGATGVCQDAPCKHDAGVTDTGVDRDGGDGGGD
jgi:hypothetical protein